MSCVTVGYTCNNEELPIAIAQVSDTGELIETFLSLEDAKKFAMAILVLVGEEKPV